MDLWADLDNNHQSPQDAAGQGRTQRTRRLNERALQSLLREWLLQDYTAAYCRSLGATRIFRRCYWIDALGIDAKAGANSATEPEQDATTTRPGKGRKKNGQQQTVPPALQSFVSLSQMLSQESKPIALHGLVLEAGSSKRKEARGGQNSSSAKTQEITMPKESGIIRASWLEAAPSLLKGIEQSPAIFLLNPFGPTMFSYDDLAPLYLRTVPTELCLLVPHKQLQARLLSALHSPARASLLTALLRTDRWRTLPIKEETMMQAIDGFIDIFITSMQRHFLLPVQRILLPVLVRPAVVETVPYTLLFATRRQDSLYSMNDAVCVYQRQVNAESHRGVLAEEWFATQQQERVAEEWQRLYLSTLRQGQTQRIRRWPDLRQQLLLANFGQFTLHDYDSVMQKLLLNKEVRCEWRQRSAEPEEERIPGNDDTLVWR